MHKRRNINSCYHCINKCTSKKSFSDELKIAEVAPIFKKK